MNQGLELTAPLTLRVSTNPYFVQVSRCAAVQVSGFLPAVSFQWRPIVGRLELKGITNVQSIAIKTQR